MKSVKLYTVTNNRGEIQKLGSNRRSTVSTIRWVIYHLKRKSRYNNLNDFLVHEIDLSNGVIIKSSAISFMESQPENIDRIKAEIKNRFGFSVDLSTLDTLYRLDAIHPNIKEGVFAYLTSKGIRF